MPENPFSKKDTDNPFAKKQEPVEAMPLGQFAGEGFLDAIGAAPSGVGDALAFLAGGAEGLVAGPFSERGFDFRGRISEQQEQFPANLISSIPRPTTAGARATVQGLFGRDRFDESFGQSMAESDAARLAGEREHPFLSQLFKLGGQAFALGAGRIPLLNRLSKTEDAIMTIRQSPEIAFSTANLAKAPTTVRRAVADAIRESKALRTIGRGSLRSLEAGLEATALDIINGEDPGATFGYAAGLQLVNSGILQGAKTLTGGPAMAKLNKMTIALVVGATAISQFQNITPITDDFGKALTESSQHITAGLIVGALSGLAGGGRFRGSTDDISKQAQVLVDMFTTVPRGTVHGMVRQWNDASPEGQEAINSLMQGMLTNADALNDRQLARIDASIKKGTFEDTATMLMRDKRLVEKLFAEQPAMSDLFDEPGAIPFEKPTQ